MKEGNLKRDFILGLILAREIMLPIAVVVEP